MPVCAMQTVPSRVLGLYKGECNATADAACASGVRAVSQVCSTAPPAAEYPTLCYAQQLSSDPAAVKVYRWGTS